MKDATWIVAANSSIAKIYLAENNKEITEIESLTHPESRMKGIELGTDKPGKSFDRVGTGRHFMKETEGMKEHEATVFAKQIAEKLEKAFHEGRLKKLYIAASPHFLGILRKEFRSPMEKIIVTEIDKDLSSQPIEKIREHLPLVL